MPVVAIAFKGFYAFVVGTAIGAGVTLDAPFVITMVQAPRFAIQAIFF